MSVSENNRRIARNTIVLYFRMIVVTLVNLYSSRLILHALGVVDYGIFNVLGGVIGMLGYVNVLLSGAISRFLTYDLGCGDLNRLKETFRVSNTLCILSITLFIIFGETVGLWFVNSHLNIEPSRMYAANWVYQCALLSAAIVVMQAPFSAAVIAHEKMSVYAGVSIVDAVLKFAVAFSLPFCGGDNLVLYGSLLVGVSAVCFLIYLVAGLAMFEECSLQFSFAKEKFKAMFSYSGWNMIMVFANILNNYGFNILLNLFYGPVVNAARGLALQVNSLVTQLFSNFQTASVPQITKYYAQGEKERMHYLICNTSKFSVALLLPVVIPLCFNTQGLLELWLGEVPDFTVAFVRIMVMISLFSAIDLPIGMGIHAVGRMMLPNVTAAVIYLGIFPITYLAMKNGASAVVGYFIFVATTPFILGVDLWILHKYTDFSIVYFFKKVILPVVGVGMLSILVPVAICLFYRANGFSDLLFKVLIDVIYVSFVVFFTIVPAEFRKRFLRFFKRDASNCNCII